MRCNRCFKMQHLNDRSDEKRLSRVLHSYFPHVTLREVKSLRFIIAPLLVALWLPASSHVLLERWELIHQVHTGHDADSDDSHEHDADNHEAADGKCASSSTHVSVPLPEMVASADTLSVLGLAWVLELHLERHPSGLDPPGTAPPQLCHRWQFSFRTALSARAPSIAS